MAAASEGTGGDSFLRRNYLPSDYVRDTVGTAVEGVVHVEAGWDAGSQLHETAWVSGVLTGAPFAWSIVAGAQLQRVGATADLSLQRRWPSVVGIRQMLDWDPTPLRDQPPPFLGEPQWESGLANLARHDLTFDLQVSVDQLDAAVELVRRHPDVLFILDHAGVREPLTPRVQHAWLSALSGFSGLSNVVVKVSGYAGVDPSWEPEHFRRYVLRLLDAFGPRRCIFASNFPFDKESISFSDLIALHAWAVDSLSTEEKDAYFAGTAQATYHLRKM